MKSFDTINRIERDDSSVRLGFDDVKSILGKPQSTEKEKKSLYFYFFKSAQVVISAWIVTVIAITVTPWLDYYVKTSINHQNSQQILGNQAPKEVTSPSPTAVGSAGFFYLKNSKIEINAPIVEGIGEDSLKMGIGHHPESPWPSTKGNVVLAGHNTDLDAENSYARVFFKLRDVSIGDQVVVNYENKNYYYKVFKSQTVSPNDNSLLQNTNDWMLTFYTCDPPYTDWKRLVFQTKLEKIE